MSRAINYKKDHGHELQDCGFSLVPIGAGEKYPTVKGWQNIESTPVLVEKWANNSRYGGLGVLGRNNPGIDIDVSDKAIVDKLVKWCHENVGITPVRVGNYPRVLLPCWAPKDSLGGQQSAKYEDMLGESHQVEIKASGQQWVAYGIHPGTGNPYTWEGGELHSMDSEFLPTLTADLIAKLFAYFESVKSADWELKGKSGNNPGRSGHVDNDGNVTSNNAFDNYAEPLSITPDQISGYLAALDPDEHYNGSGWRTIGMAIYHQFEGSEEGKDIFIEWSSTSMDFDLEEIEKRWDSWGQESYRGKPTTFATVIAIWKTLRQDAPENDTRKVKPSTLTYWTERYKMVELDADTIVHDGGVPLNVATNKKLRNFKEQTAGYLYRYIDEMGDVRMVPMANAWQESKDTEHYSGYVFYPGGERYTTKPWEMGNTANYINTFHFPPHKAAENVEERVSPFLSFLKHLFPVESEREWFTMWLARLIQSPGVRSFVTPINITHVTGTGRGLLLDILRTVVGDQNTVSLGQDDLEGRFNGYLDSCLLACVQEIKAVTGDKKFQAWERMKSAFADTVASIQKKGIDSYTAPVYANFLLFSNNIDALPLNDVNERRIYAMQGARVPVSVDQIDLLNAWRAVPENIAALFQYLQGVAVDPGAFKRAPVTETKNQMVSACIGEDGDQLDHWLKTRAPRVFTFGYAAEDMGGGLMDDGVGMDRIRFGRSLQDKGFNVKQLRIEGTRNPVRVYYDPATTGGGNVEMLRKLLDKPPEEG